MCNQSGISTLQFLATILTTGLAGFVGYISARRVSDLNTKNIECAKLRKSFARTLAKIYLTKKHGSTKDVPDLDRYFKKALINHAAAIEEFRPFVPKEERDKYQDAWEKYRYYVWDFGFNSNVLTEDIENPYATYGKLIHDILQFAEPKKVEV
jgi:hypothetical protein